MQGPRLKYVDIVTDTLHASSSDLITWNTLVMIKLKWWNGIPRQWIDITVNSLEAWEKRDQLSQFHGDTRRGYARVTPIALSHVGVPGSKTLAVDDFPKEGLGVYDDFETCAGFSGYIWATWTTMPAQPMQIDPALQALLNPTGAVPSGQFGVPYDLGIPIQVDPADQPMGSNECASGVAVPFPDSAEDVSMDSGADKRSRASPDSTLKPEGKSLKTSDTTNTPATQDPDDASAAMNAKPSNVTKRPKTDSEAKSLMREMHQRMPAWKSEKLLELSKAEQVDLAALGEATGILFESQEMLNEAIAHLREIRKEKDGTEDADLDDSKSTDNSPSQSEDQDMSEDKRSNDQKEKTNEASKGGATAASTATSAMGGTKATPEGTSGQQDATASSAEKATEEGKSVPESHKEWFNRVTKEGQEVLWPPVNSDQCPTLLTGVQASDLKSLETLGWEDKLESADLKKHMDYLSGRQFASHPHPLEATAWENGFVPETHGLPSAELEPSMLPILPQLTHMVSAPRQPIAAGNALLTRFDAHVRPYWLRDWQSDFGGYTKVYEYQHEDQTKRVYSVAHVVRPRTPTTEACLSFSLMKSLPTSKPWTRQAGQKDPSRSVLLDLRPFPNWQLPATVLDLGTQIGLDLTDDLQVQCLPVARSNEPEWTYRTLPKVKDFRTFGRIPAWGRKPQKMTYHVCAENITKHYLVPNLPEEDREALLTRGALPPMSSAWDRHCVMCPVRRGSPRLLPCALCYNWCHPGCSYQTHLGRVCPCHVQILDPKRKIMVVKYPYHEDLVVLPTRPNLRMDTKSITRDMRMSYGSQSGEAPMRWSASLWINTLLEKHAWLCAGLVWTQGASQSANIGVYREVPPEAHEARPVISLFEHWEEGAHLPVAVNARDYAFTGSGVPLVPSTTSIKSARCTQQRVNTRREEDVGTGITNQLGVRDQLSKSTQKRPGFSLE